MKDQVISLIIPVFNEGENLIWHHDKISAHLKNKRIPNEIIYVDDGSSDDSLEIIKQLAVKDSRVRFLSFSRNFGKESATSAGLRVAKGDAVILIDADGQHPIDAIPEFIKRWQEGYQVIIGVRGVNKHENWVKKYGSKIFYKILGVLMSSEAVPASTDFRLMDRIVVDEFNKLTEHNRITRGLIDWLGFKRTYVTFEPNERIHGTATYTLGKLLKLALNAFVSQSTKPLKFIGALGMAISLLAVSAALVLWLEQYAFGDPLELSISASGFLAVFITFLVGVVLTSQGLLALYIESIHADVQNRPLYIVAESSVTE